MNSSAVSAKLTLAKSDLGFRWPIRVYYEDTDAGGVVFHARYLCFMERARTERLRRAGFELDQLQREQGILFVVRAAEVEFLKPARFNEVLEVTAELMEVRAASVYFEQRIYRGEELLCRGVVRVVVVDAGAFKPRIVPPFLIEGLRVRDAADPT